MKAVLLLVLFQLLLVPAASDARTWLVRQDGSGDCLTAQACIDSATASDTVLVGPGIYYENLLLREAATGVVLTSELGPSLTIIDGGAHDRVITCDSVGSGTVIEGFTIRNGRISGPFCPSGAGVRCWRSRVSVVNNIICENNADMAGGGGVCLNGGACVLSGNVITQNYATGGGAGLEISYDSSLVISNTIVSNTTDHIAGGIYVGGGATLCNNIVATNVGLGIFCRSGIASTLECNDAWGNSGDNYKDCTPGESNFSLNPLFCDPEVGDYQLSENSPCVNASGCGQVGALGVGCGPIGVKEENLTTWGRIKALYR